MPSTVLRLRPKQRKTRRASDSTWIATCQSPFAEKAFAIPSKVSDIQNRKGDLMNRTIVVGDIHGCFDELISLLKKLDLQSADKVVAVGDLTVKGPKSKDVLDLFMSDKRFSSVLGNHDLGLVRFWKGETTNLKDSLARTWEELKSVSERYLQYLASLPLMVDLGKHLVVHAGVRPGVPLNQQSPGDLTELRTLGPDRTSRKGMPWYEEYDGEKVVLFGHWPAAEPRRGKRAIGLDTGCVYGYCLTAYVLETGEFISTPAARAYDVPTLPCMRPSEDRFPPG